MIQLFASNYQHKIMLTMHSIWNCTHLWITTWYCYVCEKYATKVLKASWYFLKLEWKTKTENKRLNKSKKTNSSIEKWKILYYTRKGVECRKPSQAINVMKSSVEISYFISVIYKPNYKGCLNYFKTVEMLKMIL